MAEIDARGGRRVVADRIVAGVLVALTSLWIGGGARAADGVPADTVDSFACLGEAAAIMRGAGTDEIRQQRDRLLGMSPVPGFAAAHRSCLIAELMRRVGDLRAAEYYRRAVAESGGAPGYEQRHADYLRTVRGPRASLIESAERHFQAALDGVRSRRDTPAPADAVVEEWSKRGLMLLYQQDGLPLLPWKAYPYDRPVTPRPGLALTVGGRFAVDTNDVPVDLGSAAAVDDARRFTSEAMFSASSFRQGVALGEDQLRAIARAPRREEVLVRARLRPGPLGAIDLWYRGDRIHDAQITNFSLPSVRNDVTLAEMGAGYARAFDFNRAFDFLLAGNYRRVHRVGVVEFFPGQAQDFNQFEIRPVIARFLGPDKLSLGGGYVRMAIPDVAGGVIEDRARGRTIRAVNLDYAIYRPLFLPQVMLGSLVFRRRDTRGLHLFAGVADDDETFGIRVVRRRDAHLGVGLRGWGAWDFTVQGALFTGAVDVRPLDSQQTAGTDPQQSNAQYRTTITVLRRIVDEDAIPGLPAGWFGVRPSKVDATLTLRHDLRVDGLYAFQNVRAGVHVSAKVFATPLRGTAFLVGAGYEAQYFYNIVRTLHIAHVDVTMGW